MHKARPNIPAGFSIHYKIRDENTCRTIDECYDTVADHTENEVYEVTDPESPEVRVRPLYIVTPTYTRPTQLAGESPDHHRCIDQ